MDASLYLFDGYNLLHAGAFVTAAEVIDALASFVATRGVRGVVVFDGVGQDAQRGPLSVRYSAHADDLLERLAAEHRTRERVVLVTSDATVAGTAGPAVVKLTSQAFIDELEPAHHRDDVPGGLGDKLDPATRARLEQLRRGE